MSASMALFALVVIAFVALSARIGRVYVSAPMVFMVAGFGFGSTSVYGLGTAGIQAVAVTTLALLLFHGAAELKPRDLLTESLRASRLLLIALPLTMVATFFLVRHLVPELNAWLAVLLAAALAPTDSALAPATVLNPSVPVRVRRMLNLESGLNDGLATPVVLFAISAAAGTLNGSDHDALTAVMAIVIGVAFGAPTGAGVGHALRLARGRGWADEKLVPLAVLATPLFAYFGADAAGGNGFMAAFISGITYATTKTHSEALASELDVVGLASALLGGAAWMLFGAASAAYLAALVHWQTLVIAVASLTVLRMVPVALSLIGSGLHRRRRSPRIGPTVRGRTRAGLRQPDRPPIQPRIPSPAMPPDPLPC